MVDPECCDTECPNIAQGLNMINKIKNFTLDILATWIFYSAIQQLNNTLFLSKGILGLEELLFALTAAIGLQVTLRYLKLR